MLLGVQFADAQIQTTIESPQTVIEAPGPATGAVVQFLERIWDGYRESNRPLESMLIKGRVSRVERRWSPEIEPQTLITMPPESWNSFQLVHKDGRRRYEQDYVTSNTKPLRVYRIMDTEGIYKLDGNALYISGLENMKDVWADLDGSVLNFEQVFDGIKYVPIVETCQHLIDQLEGRVPNNVWEPDERRLRCTDRGGVLTVEKIEGPAIPSERSGYWHSFSVDSNRGFRLVARSRHSGGTGRGLDYAETATLELEEPATGIFVPFRGVQFVATLGTVDQREGSAAWIREDFQVDEVKFGDFKYDDALLSWKALPIPKGAYVEDRRVDPPLTFRFGEAPLDQQILDGALRGNVVRRTNGFYLVVFNVLAIAALFVGIFVRRLLVSKATRKKMPDLYLDQRIVTFGVNDKSKKLAIRHRRGLRIEKLELQSDLGHLIVGDREEGDDFTSISVILGESRKLGRGHLQLHAESAGAKFSDSVDLFIVD